MSEPSAGFQLRFLDYLQRLFAEGEFTATYKFALLMALADLSVERADDTDTVHEISSRDIARKFIRYYERQTLPLPGIDKAGTTAIIHQNTGSQARIVNLVREEQDTYAWRSGSASMSAPGSKLITQVAQTVREQPLWKLQTLSRRNDDFFYPNEGKGDVITLRPGIAFCFRRFHGFVYSLAQARWIAFVRECRQNLDLLGENVDLGEFMFGAQRGNLDKYRKILEDIQSGQCFYCFADLKRSDVDHFIPWSRYSVDLGDNFVLACKSCNNAKRDTLAYVGHLENWVRRNEDHRSALDQYFREAQLPHDLAGSRMITKWAYTQADEGRAQVWVRGKQTVELDGGWREFV